MLQQPSPVFRLFPAIVDQQVVQHTRDLSLKYMQDDAGTSGTAAVNQQISEQLISHYSDLYKTEELNDETYAHRVPEDFDDETESNKFFELIESIEDSVFESRESRADILDYRQCSRWSIPLEYEGWLVSIADHLCKIANNDWGFDLHYLNQMDLLRYTAVEDGRGDHYDWHTDAEFLPNYNTPQMFVDNPKFTRKLTAILQLSGGDEYEGGNLEIAAPDGSNALTHYNLAIRQVGSVIVFPSYLAHRVTPVTKGERMSIVMWMNGRSWS